MASFFDDYTKANGVSSEFKEKRAAKLAHLTEEDILLKKVEEGLCKKYGIEVPTYRTNRRQDRGESGEELLILGQTVNDRRNPKLWGIRQEDRTRHIFLLGPSGSGKCLTQNIKVLTYNARSKKPEWKKNGDLKIGDLVYTRNGITTKITDIFEHSGKDIWEMKLADGQIIECSEDHNWIVKRKSHNLYVEDVKTTKEIFDYGVLKTSPEGKTYRPLSIPVCAPMDFPKKKLPIPPYTLGALLGDGCTCLIGNRVEISTADMEILDLMKNELGEDFYFDKKNKEDEHQYSWTICELTNGNTHKTTPTIKKALIQLNLCCRAHEKFIPEIYKFASIEQRRALLKGLMDTDGTAHKGRFSFSTSSKQLRDDIMELARSLGYICSYRTDRRPEKYVHVDECYEVQIRSNDYENIFGLERKKQEYLEYASQKSQNAVNVYNHAEAKKRNEDINISALPVHPYLVGLFMRFIINAGTIATRGTIDNEIIEIAQQLCPGIEFRKTDIETTPYLDLGRMKNGKHKNGILWGMRELSLNVTVKKRRIPRQYLDGSIECRQYLLQGLFDDSGKFTNNTVYYNTVSSDLADDIEELAISLGYDVSRVYTKSNKAHTISIGIADDTMFLAPSHCEKARKLIRTDATRSNMNNSISIVDVRKTDRKADMRCIRVADESKSYIVDGYVVTHNSTLLHALGVEDMWYWRGGLLMEPHGDLALSLLRTAPPYRLHDIIYLNVLDSQASPGFNPLELPLDATDDQRQEAVGAVTSLIQKHFNMEAGYVKLVKMLTTSLNVLSYVPGATLLEIMDFYNNEDMRNTMLQFVPEGPMRDTYADIGMNAKADDLGSLDSRMSRFSTNRYMKHLFGQSHTTVDFFDLMNKGYYIICPVSKGGTQDDIFLKFYGSYIVSQVYKAATMRESIAEGDRVNFAMTLDEFQNFMSDDIEGILAEARKYGLQLMLANQYLMQLTPTIEAAVLQNCATKLSYNLGPADAPKIAKTYGNGITAADMQSIPKYHVMAAPLIRGGNVRPFISAVFPPITMNNELAGQVEAVIAERTRDKFMKNRDDIDAEIAERKQRLASGNKEAVIELMKKKNR